MKHSPADFNIAKLSNSGQVVVPKEIRKKMSLNTGQKFMIFEQDGDIILTPIGSLLHTGWVTKQ